MFNLNNMKKITINNEVCEKYGISVKDFLYLLFLYSKGDIGKTRLNLVKKNLIAPEYEGMEISNYSVMDQGKTLIDNVILDSSDDSINDDRITYLVNELRRIFPDGKKDGTALHWKGNSKEIANRLKGFFVKYGDFTDEEIINATQRYVDSFINSGSFKNMRLLKYFIWKRVDTGGSLEDSSDLLTFIENADSSAYEEDWTTNLK